MFSEPSFPKDTPRGEKEFIPPHVEQAWEKSKKILSRDAIDMDGFEDLYGKENVERDKRTVSRIEEKFDHRFANDAYAETLEGILYEQIELSDWLGPNATTIKTSRFDDIVNGTDLVVEFEDQSQSFSHLALAVDVTFGTMKMEKKFQRIQDEIESGTLGTIKYFDSQARHMRAELKKVPRVVIGIEKKEVIELCRMWMSGNNRELGEHPVQKLFLREIEAQLKALKAYAERVQQNQIAAIYERELAKIAVILAEKKDLKLGKLEEDKVYQAIKAQLERLV